MKHILVLTMILTVLIISGCAADSEPAQIANPASKQCVDEGGKLDIREEEDGEVGYCIFPDGSECEEWTFFHGDCTPGGQESAGMPNPASKHCTDEGGKLEIREETDGAVGYCIFPDGSECEEWEFYRGKCKPDTQ